MVFTLVYVSDSNISPVGNLSQVELSDIETQSKFNNSLYDVRGFLFYYEKHFLQILQGEFDSIICIFAKIKDDPRHRNVRVIWFSDDAEFAFEDWSMLYSMEFARQHFQKLSTMQSLVGRFVPEKGNLSEPAHRVLMNMAMKAQQEMNSGAARLYG